MNFFTPLGSTLKSEENMLAKDNGENITSTLGCRHLSVVEHLIKQFTNNFSLDASKGKKVTKSKTIE
jgi:hypothetical protein